MSSDREFGKSGPTAIDRLVGRVLGEEALWGRLTRRRVRHDVEAGRRMLFVHQMGKVGSQAVFRAVLSGATARGFAVHHTHFLTRQGLDFLAGLYREGHGSWRAVPERDRRFIVTGRALSKELRSGNLRDVRYSVISLIRDPVATNLSGFFHNSAWWPRGLAEAVESRRPGWRDALMQHFLKTYPQDLPLTWFEREMDPVFGIDVYAEPFPRDVGWKVYHGASADLLLLKFEELGACASGAIGSFLALTDVNLPEYNRAADKAYAATYADFLARLSLPAAYLERMYASRHSAHFYGGEEMAGFRRRWRGGDLAVGY